MNYLTLEKVTKTYGPRVLFRDLTLHVDKGQKVSIVAKNGTGKSTLMRVMTGEDAPEGEQGKVLIHKSIRVGYLPQEPDFGKNETPLDALFEADMPALRALRAYQKALYAPDSPDELSQAMQIMDDLKAWDMEAQMREILFRLGITKMDQRIVAMSGGQRKRLALAKLLIEQPDLLILDEPTNHLDIEMIEWLEQFLQQPNLTLILVSHDRYMIDNVCDTILELDNGTLFKYKGNYADYIEKKALRLEVDAANRDRNKKLFNRELEWMRRQPQARTTKAKSREDSFYDLEEKVKQKQGGGNVQLDIKGQWLGSKIVELHAVSKQYGDLIICRELYYKFRRMERVGIVGPNGAGKSTLLRMITGQEKPDSGRVVIGDTVVFGYYGQDGLLNADDKRVLEVITDIAEYLPLEKGKFISAAQLLERFLFPREQQQVYVSQLSGGERRRLYLLTVLMQNPNFLILDEPTNDLDIATLNVLEDFLLEYPGCVLVVSHDRYFLDKVAEHLFVFEGEGKLVDINGNYSEYREERKALERQQAKVEKSSTAAAETTKVSTAPKKLGFNEKREFERLEKEIPVLEARRQTILDLFAHGSAGEDARKLQEELAQVQADLDLKELRWMELAELAD
jgi:ATP-binding cassette subfamily F protein uup